MVDTVQRIVLAARPAGLPSSGDFRLEAATSPEPRPGQFRFRTLWLSVDPYMIGVMLDAAIGSTMEGDAVAEVGDSRHAEFRPGDLVVGPLGWTTDGVSDGAGLRRLDRGLGPISTALGVLGMPGHTGWYGLTRVARGRPGETILVSAATGAVGSVVAQLARRAGLRVIGVAGGPAKCSYAVDALKCHACLDYRAAADAAALGDAIGAAAPDGIDIYYDNVGGKTLAAVLSRMNLRGRIALCGRIAWYGGVMPGEDYPLEPAWQTILRRRLSVEGFVIDDHPDTLPAFLADLVPVVRDGSVVYRETIAEGLDAAPAAFVGLFRGDNLGKQLVRVAGERG